MVNLDKLDKFHRTNWSCPVPKKTSLWCWTIGAGSALRYEILDAHVWQLVNIDNIVNLDK